MPMKIYELRFRQFARGWRSIRTMTIPAERVEDVKERFELSIQLMRRLKLTSVCHAQLISVFEKEA
jgi:hypothetical protein